jgi:hypothetical protein
MKRDCDGEENRSRHCAGFITFQHPPPAAARKNGFWNPMFLYVCASRYRLNCWPDFTHIRHLKVHTYILAQKTRTFDMGPKSNTSIFRKTALVILNKFQYIMVTISLNKSAYVVRVSSGK